MITNTEPTTRGEPKDEIRKYIKFRVELDLEKPIVPGWLLDRGSQPPVWIEFRYEKLPNFCLNCGRFSHETRLCSSVPPHPTHHTKFGPRLRAEHIVVERIQSAIRSPSQNPSSPTDSQSRKNSGASGNTDHQQPGIQSVDVTIPTPTATRKSANPSDRACKLPRIDLC